MKRPPEHPKVIQTRFLLYTRSTRESPKNLHYDDDSTSTLQPEFNSTKSLKVIIHGYKGSGSDVGAILLVQAFLDIVINAYFININALFIKFIYIMVYLSGRYKRFST